jgi:hypothetical protein
MGNSCSTVVEHLPHHAKVKGSCQAATAGTEREKRHSSIVVKQLPRHPKVEDSSPATVTRTVRVTIMNGQL